MKLVSACLLGEKCRYDGEAKPCEKLIALAKTERFLPVCPERLAGLSTPRERSEQRGNNVFTESGRDVTAQFRRGAEEVLRLAKENGVKTAILKSKSPSCGSGQVYDGTFSGRLVAGDGVTAALLKRNSIKVLTEKDY